MKLDRIGAIIAMAVVLQGAVASTAEVALDYDFFKSHVEPIFLKQRPNHGRCYVCHSASNNAFRLQKLAPGVPWTEEESQRNFQRVVRLVVAGDPARASFFCSRSRLRLADSLFIPAAGNFLLRTILIGRSSPSGCAGIVRYSYVNAATPMQSPQYPGDRPSALAYH